MNLFWDVAAACVRSHLLYPVDDIAAIAIAVAAVVVPVAETPLVRPISFWLDQFVYECRSVATQTPIGASFGFAVILRFADVSLHSKRVNFGEMFNRCK